MTLAERIKKLVELPQLSAEHYSLAYRKGAKHEHMRTEKLIAALVICAEALDQVDRKISVEALGAWIGGKVASAIATLDAEVERMEKDQSPPHHTK